jgi:hypothetical protein
MASAVGQHVSVPVAGLIDQNPMGHFMPDMVLRARAARDP